MPVCYIDADVKILRSMLYRGSEIMREVAWVIFDEVHYIARQGTRCLFGKETIILLPDKVRYVFLSRRYPMLCNLRNGLQKIITSHATLFIPTFDPHHYSIISSCRCR